MARTTPSIQPTQGALPTGTQARERATAVTLLSTDLFFTPALEPSPKQRPNSQQPGQARQGAVGGIAGRKEVTSEETRVV